MEFDPDFKLLLSPDKVAETNATIEGAIIQASAAIEAAKIQAQSAVDAANTQWNATIWGSAAVIIAALVAFFSAMWQVSTEKRIYKDRVNAYRRFLGYKCEGIYLRLSQAKFIVGGANIASSEDPLGSVGFAFSFLDCDIEDMSPKSWETHALLGGEVMGLINDLFASMVMLRETKETALKKLSLLNCATSDSANPQSSAVITEKFLEEFESQCGSILYRLKIVKERNDDLINYLGLPAKKSLLDVLWS